MKQQPSAWTGFRFQRFFFKREFIMGFVEVVPGLLMGLLWFLHDFPARMSSDSITTWDQVINANYHNDHPVFYTFYVKILSMDGRYVWMVALFQIFLTVFILQRIFKGFDFNSITVSTLIFLSILTPVFGAFVTTIWKDVPFSLFLLLSAVYAKDYLISRSNRDLAKFAVLLTIGISFRHNGWLLAIALIPVGFLVLRTIARVKGLKKIGLVVACSILASQLISNALIVATDTVREEKFLSYLSFATDLAYISSAHPVKSTPEIDRLVGTFSTGDSFTGAANCTGVGYMIIPNGFLKSGIEQNSRQILTVWLESTTSKLNLILEARKCRALPFLPPPLIDHPVHPTWLANGIYQPNEFALAPQRVALPFIGLLTSWEKLWQKYALIVAWPGALGLFGTLILGFFSRKKTGTSSYLLGRILIVLVWSTLLPLSVIALAPDYRYAATAQFVGIIGVGVFLQFLSAAIRSLSSRLQNEV
jgi:hypothetical protein